MTYLTPQGAHTDQLTLKGVREQKMLYPRAARVESMALSVDGCAPLSADSLCITYRT